MYVLRTLGTLDLGGGEGERILSVLSQSKRFGLLVYLAAARPRGFHRRDTLLGLFWPDLDQERARAALSSSLYFLRRSLTQELLVSRGDGEVGLDQALLRDDVAAFESALDAGEPDKALELYGGDFLKGFFLSDCPAFEQWADGVRERLRRAAAEAGWALARRHLDAGEFGHAERIALEALGRAPTDEHAVRSFVARLADGGDRAAALRFYERFAGLLEAELEVAPSAETRAVADRILAEEKGSPEPGTVEREVSSQPPPVEPRGHASPSPALPGPTRPVRAGARRWAPAVAVAALVGVPATLWWAGGGGAPPADDAVAAVSEESAVRIAVVPPWTRGEGGDAAPWGDLAAEAILRAVERAGLQVVPLAAVRAAAGSDPSAAAIATATGATHVLTGTVTALGSEVRFDLQIAAGDGSHPRTLEPISGRSDAMGPTLEVVATRAAAAAEAVTDRGHPLNPFWTLPQTPDALHRLNRATDLFTCEEDWRGAIDLLEPLLDEYPDYVPVLYWLGAAYGNVGSGALRAKSVDRLRLLVDRMTPYERAWYEMWTSPTSGGRVRAAEAAFAIDSATQGHILAVQALAANRLDLALRGAEAFHLPPHCPWAESWVVRTQIHHLRGEYADELRWARDGISSLENASMPSRFENTALLMHAEARALAALDSVDAARAVVARMADLPTSVAWAVAVLARDVARHGRPAFGEELQRLAVDLLARPQEPRGIAAAATLYHAGAWERLLSLAREIDDGPGDPTPGQLRSLIAALERTGRREEADAAQARLTALYPDSPYRAGLPRMRGDVGEGVRALVDVMARGGSLYSAGGLWLHLGPWDASVYSDPRFEAFLRQAATRDEG